MNVLEINNVTKRFGNLVAVRDVSLNVAKGELCAIIGPNGAGKTTFFNLISGFFPPTSGSIIFDVREKLGAFGSADPGSQTISAGYFRRDTDVFEYRQFGEDFGDLESPRHPSRHALMRGKPRDVLAVEDDAAGSRRKESADQVEEGGLAGAVRPDDRA